MTWQRLPTHRRRYVRTKLVVRTKMLDAVRDQLLAWLEARPAISAVEALERLRGLYPDRFGAGQLRTVQRFMKLRRAAMAREVLLGPMPCPGALGMMAAAGEDRILTADDTEMPGSIAS